MEPFFIEVDLFDNNKPVQLFIIPEMIDNETTSVFKIDYEDTKLATLAMDMKSLNWYAMDEDLDEDSVAAIGEKIDNYFFNL
jgi:hypothetical protein